MSFQPAVLWHSKYWSMRACSLPAIFCEIIEKPSREGGRSSPDARCGMPRTRRYSRGMR